MRFERLNNPEKPIMRDGLDPKINNKKKSMAELIKDYKLAEDPSEYDKPLAKEIGRTTKAFENFKEQKVLVEAAKNPIIINELKQFEINGDKFFKYSGINSMKIKNPDNIDDKIINKLLKSYLPNFKKDVNKFIDDNYNNWYADIDVSKENVKNLANILFDTFIIEENKGNYELEFWIASNTASKGAKYFFGNHSLVQEYTVDKDGKLIKKNDCYLAG